MKKTLKLFYFFIILITLNSCKKEFLKEEKPSLKQELNPDQKKLVSNIRETSEILSEMLIDDKFRVEFAKYFGQINKVDHTETLKLKNLLSKNEIKDFSTTSLNDFQSKFREKFEIAYTKVASKLNSDSDIQNNIKTLSDEVIETYNDVEVYFPYQEEPIVMERFLAIRPSITYVDDDSVESNEKEGTLKYWYDEDPNTRGDEYWVYTGVYVDDAYAELYPTLIVRPISISNPPPSIEQPDNLRVYCGWVKLTQQYDSLFGGIFGGDGGGSELFFYKVKGYVNSSLQNGVDYGEDFEVKITRRDIRKQNWIRVYRIWDHKWDADETEQVFGCYEKDKQGDQTYTGSIKYKEIIDLNYSRTVKSENQLISSSTFDRDAYLAENVVDLGHGFRENFPIRAFSSGLYVTMPHNFY